MKEKTPQDCPLYRFCSQNLCPFDSEIDKVAGTKKDLCLNFEMIKCHLSAQQKERYVNVVDKLK